MRQALTLFALIAAAHGCAALAPDETAAAHHLALHGYTDITVGDTTTCPNTMGPARAFAATSPHGTDVHGQVCAMNLFAPNNAPTIVVDGFSRAWP